MFTAAVYVIIVDRERERRRVAQLHLPNHFINCISYAVTSNKIIMNCEFWRKGVDGNDCNLSNVTSANVWKVLRNPHEELRLLTAVLTRNIQNAKEGFSFMIYFTTLSLSKTTQRRW
jgi:hypothetical protein